MWGGVLCGWNFIWDGILCGTEFYSKWGGMSKIVILYEFFQFSERLASKRTEPLNSSIEDGSESLNIVGYFSTKPWSCMKSRNLAGDERILKYNILYETDNQGQPIVNYYTGRDIEARGMVQDLEEKVEMEIRKVLEKKIEDKVANLEKKVRQEFERKIENLQAQITTLKKTSDKEVVEKLEESIEGLKSDLASTVQSISNDFKKTTTKNAESIEELQEDVEENTLLLTNVKAENSKQTKEILDLKLSSYANKIKCSQKYVEAFNKVSYISGKISVKLSYNSLNLADGIILTTKGNKAWAGQTVILPVKGITKYKVDSWLQETYMTIGWTEHTQTNAGFLAMGYGTPKFDKSIGLHSSSGGYYGISGNGEKIRWEEGKDLNFRFKTVGSSLVAINDGGKFTWKVGSHSRDFDASSYFSNELYPAFSIWTTSETSIKISEINFSGLQC